MPGSQAFAVDHANAAEPQVTALQDELPQGIARLEQRHTVQVDFFLDRIVATPELPPHFSRHMRSVKLELIARFDVERVRAASQQFVEYVRVVLLRKLRVRFRSGFFGQAPPAADRLDIADHVAE